MNKIISYKNAMTKFILVIFISLVSVTQTHALLPTEKQQTKAAELQAKHNGEVVVLIHGLMRTSLSMSSLKYFLQSYGYQVYVYSYPSTQQDIHAHGVDLYQFIATLLEKNPDIKIHFITHSLGGIIIRESLAKLTRKELNQVGCLIMLAPPNQGSVLAKLTVKMFPIISNIIKPLAELSSDEKAYVHQVPIPNIKMGIIAGRFDAKVPPSSARLPGQTELVVINTNHALIMNNSKSRQLILTFLENGKFEE
ncbi:alpha/beta fold hydrolase [Legionella sp.]|uniref:esterase/lipase family protein n=1 Tax=Legionella sp. TaxID=459 RepID=UPI000CA80155|nr:alpha/beta fold hydrolase [Legionella sp.]PJE07719.1 MAG: lipase [Legionella sp.]